MNVTRGPVHFGVAIFSAGNLHAAVRRLLPTRGNAAFTIVVALGLIAAQRITSAPSSPTAATPHLAAATAPVLSTQTIAYQGRLTDATGGPLQAGTYHMTFSLYNQAAGAQGGAPLWTEAQPAVQVGNGGLFDVLLGSLSPIPESVIAGNGSLWLGVAVGSDSEMTPLVQLSSVPYAMQANQASSVANGSITTNSLEAGAVTQAQLAPTPSAETVQTTTTSFVAIPGASKSITTTGGTVLVLFNESETVDTAGAHLQFKIVRDGSTVVSWSAQDFPVIGWQLTSLSGIDTPPPGTHSYTLEWQVDRGTVTAGAGVYSQNLAVIELKR